MSEAIYLAQPPGANRRTGVDLRAGTVLPWLLALITVLFLVSFLAYPVLLSVMKGFVPKGAPLSLSNLTFDNFARFATSKMYRVALWNTVWISVVSTVLASLLAIPAAYAVARIDIGLRSVIMALSIVPLISPPFIGAYSWVVLFGRSGIATHYMFEWFGITLPPIYGPFGIVLGMTLANFPYVFLFTQGALAANDPAMEEAARMMGASRLRVFFTVTLPMVTPSVLAGALLVLIECLGEFGIPAVLGGETYVLSTLMYFQINGYFNLNAAGAISLVNVLIVLTAIGLLLRLTRGRRFVGISGRTRSAIRSRNPLARVLGALWVWSVLAFAMLPQMIVVLLSFVETWPGTLWPLTYGLSNYSVAMQHLKQPVLNSLLLAGIATLVCILFGTATGYAAERRQLPAKWALDLTIALPFILPGIMTGVALLTVYNSGPVVLSGTAFILIIAYIVRRLTYSYRAAVAAVSRVDPALEEASAICGATQGATLRRITLPLVAPGLLAAGIIVFSTLITEMSSTVILYSAHWKTISIAIYERLEAHEINSAAAISTIALALALLLVFTASKIVGRSMADLFR